MKLCPVTLEEDRLLEKLVLEQLDGLAGKIQLLDQALGSEAGPICLGMDEDRCFAVLIFSIHEDDSTVIKALAQVGWIYSNRSLLARLYNQQGIDAELKPRIILIAPSFSKALKSAVPYIGLDVELYRYRALEVNHERGLLLDPIMISEKRSPVRDAAAKPKAVVEAPASRNLTETERNFLEGSPARNLPV